MKGKITLMFHKDIKEKQSGFQTTLNSTKDNEK